MLTALFLGFVALMAALVVALSARYLKGRTAIAVGAGLLLWLTYAGMIGYCGLIRNTTMRPPGIAFLFVPVAVFFAVNVTRMLSPSGERFALAFPLWMILGTQSFRIVVELFLHQLWREGIVPKMVTFEGANVDVYVGASAWLAAWLSTRGRGGLKLALLWNVLGLLALANVVTRAVLTTPGPLNLISAEVPNLMIGTFPFTFIAAFFVPLAVALHMLAIRSIRSRLRTEEEAGQR